MSSLLIALSLAMVDVAGCDFSGGVAVAVRGRSIQAVPALAAAAVSRADRAVRAGAGRYAMVGRVMADALCAEPGNQMLMLPLLFYFSHVGLRHVGVCPAFGFLPR